MMISQARYVHTNLIARDGKSLAQVHGVHLRLPGFEDGGPPLKSIRIRSKRMEPGRR